jgi:hypothetical protein
VVMLVSSSSSYLEASIVWEECTISIYERMAILAESIKITNIRLYIDLYRIDNKLRL